MSISKQLKQKQIKDRIARIDRLLASGLGSIVVDGVTTKIDTRVLHEERQYLLQQLTSSKPLFVPIDMSG